MKVHFYRALSVSGGIKITTNEDTLNNEDELKNEDYQIKKDDLKN